MDRAAHKAFRDALWGSADELRVFVESSGPVVRRDVDEMLRREAEFDPDLWIIEVEDREARSFLEAWLARQDT